MDIESMLLALVAWLVLLVGLGLSVWAYYTCILLYHQWLTPVGKAIVITGCDSGIGFQLAKHLHQKGSFIIATVLSSQSAGAVQLQDELKGDRFHLLQLDLKSKASLTEAAQRIENILLQSNLALHALLNNAGVCVFGEFDFCTLDQIEDQININLLGTISLTKLLLPLIIKSKGRIVMTSSVNAMVSFPGICVYSATKSALEAFGESLRIELHKFDVQVVNVRLGDYAKLTNIMAQHQQVVAHQEEGLSQSKRQLYGDYFHKYHQSAMSNYGLFSPKSFEASPLFPNFEEAVYSVTPRKYILSATLSYKWLIYFLAFIPAAFREYLLRRFTDSMVQRDKKIN